MVRSSRLLFAVLLAAGVTLPALAYAGDGGYFTQMITPATPVVHTKNDVCYPSDIWKTAPHCSRDSHAGERGSPGGSHGHDASR